MITYCINADCPFKECHRHLTHVREIDMDSNKYVNIASYDGVCRDYIWYLIEGIEHGFM